MVLVSPVLDLLHCTAKSHYNLYLKIDTMIKFVNQKRKCNHTSLANFFTPSVLMDTDLAVFIINSPASLGRMTGSVPPNIVFPAAKRILALILGTSD